MAVPPSTLQRFKVDGELQIDTSAGYKESKGLISFIGPFKQKLGQIRAYGFGSFNTLLMDASNCLAGFEIRTSTNQGSASLISGKEDQMPLSVSGDITKIKQLNVTQDPTSFRNQFFGSALAQITRQNTTAASSLANNVLEIVQNQWKIGETMRVVMGAGTFGGSSIWSYTLPTTTSGSSADNYSSLSMLRNGTVTENIRMFPDGKVTIPNGLTVPSLPPLTLSGTRVGINNTAPAYTLDVIGNIACSTDVVTSRIISNSLINAGTLSTDTVTAQHYLNLPLEPLTLSGTRVGINQSSPMSELDVVGSASISGDLVVIGDIYTNTVTADDITLLGRIDADVVFANTYQNLPLSPLTLAPPRVGINKTNPLQTLHVGGNAQVDNDIYCANIDVSGVITTQTIYADTYLNLPPKPVYYKVNFTGAVITPAVSTTAVTSIGPIFVPAGLREIRVLISIKIDTAASQDYIGNFRLTSSAATLTRAQVAIPMNGVVNGDIAGPLTLSRPDFQTWVTFEPPSSLVTNLVTATAYTLWITNPSQSQRRINIDPSECAIYGIKY
jgi:hypothetical protein